MPLQGPINQKAPVMFLYAKKNKLQGENPLKLEKQFAASA
jgi:hypothetical protein